MIRADSASGDTSSSSSPDIVNNVISLISIH
jgi:hypothetical protein